MFTQNDMKIAQLGKCGIESPLKDLLGQSELSHHFVEDNQKAVFYQEVIAAKDACKLPESIPALEIAGPRAKIFFEPGKTSAAIVTCGGVCPGLNDVIRSIVMTLHYRYGVHRILGIRYGYQGFIPQKGHAPVELTPESVKDIHKMGGTLLGTSRGQQDSGEIVDFLRSNNIQLLFVIGGDGTQRGALEIARLAESRGLNLSVIGIPKTVDNDILFIDRSFGFETAVTAACRSIETASAEADSQIGGIGLVKLMGRHSGFITCFAALATSEANFVLIPEVPFQLEGERGLLRVLEERIKKRNHAVILVAEGAGQNLIEGAGLGTDASGNIKFKDIGLYLKDRINAYFRDKKTEINLKYIDPSYIIRAVPASAADSIYCFRLGEHAVHAAMSGRTKMVVGLRHNLYVHLPMDLIAGGRRAVDPESNLWLSVLESTGQPFEIRDTEQASS